jgi:dolichol kinase
MQIPEYILPEVKRKIFHSIGLIFPLIYYFLEKLPMTCGLFVLTILIVYIDNIRHTNIQLQTIIDKLFNSLMRDQERSGTKNLSGITYFISGLFISAFLFPKAVAITSWLVLIISDSLAALTGKAIGKPYIGNKSIEGSIAFLVTSIMVSMTAFGIIGYSVTFSAIVFSAIATTYIELYSESIGINDNFSIPISFGLFLIIINYITN